MEREGKVTGELTSGSRNSTVALVVKSGGMGVELHFKHPTSKFQPNSHSIHHPKLYGMVLICSHQSANYERKKTCTKTELKNQLILIESDRKKSKRSIKSAKIREI